MSMRTKRILASSLVFLPPIVALLSWLPLGVALPTLTRKPVSLERPTESHAVAPSTSDELWVDQAGLSALPDIVELDGRQDPEILSKIGVPSDEVMQVTDSLKRAIQEAVRLRKIETQTLRFEKNQRTTIEPIPGQIIDKIVSEFESSLSKNVDSEALVFLLRKQLEKQFGRRIWATLQQPSYALPFSHYTHTPASLIGWVFAVEIENPDGSLEKLFLDPVQSENNEYFFLNALQ